MNKVIIVGYLGRDAEVRYLPSGDALATLSIATTERWKDKSGAKQERTEWHRVVFFGRTAEVCGQYLGKGSLVQIEGSLTTRKWKDRDGNDRYTTEVRGQRMQMLVTKAPDGKPEAPESPIPESVQAELAGMSDDDIPF